MLFLFLFEEIMTQAWWFNSHDFIMHATDLNFRSQRGPQFSQSWRKVLEEKDCNCGLDVTVSWSDLGQITSECGYLLQRKGCSVGECREVLWRCVCEGVQVLWSYVSKRLHVCEWANERRRKREREREREREKGLRCRKIITQNWLFVLNSTSHCGKKYPSNTFGGIEADLGGFRADLGSSGPKEGSLGWMGRNFFYLGVRRHFCRFWSLQNSAMKTTATMATSMAMMAKLPENIRHDLKIRKSS